MPNNLQTTIIPQPKPDPILKNIKEIDGKAPVQSLMRLARTYGPIYRLSLPTRDLLVVSSQELVNELCDEKRFDKKVHASLEKIRDFAGDGLFTAYTQEPNWGKAHRILVPAFGPASIRNMFDPMLDIADQMLTKWERFGESTIIDVVDSMTRLTLDTIALCAFDYRFNSYYQNEMHPFVHAMVMGLEEAGAQTRRLSIQNKLMLFTQRKYEENIKYMRKVASQLITERKRDPNGSTKKDLLNLMLAGRDPVTGEGLSDENISYQMITFLIAGHETTSGMLSFTLYELLKHPHVLVRAKAEVDEVIGQEVPRYEHIAKLTYIDQIFKESLRIWPTAPAIGFLPYENTTLGGKYAVTKDDTIIALLPTLHRDPKVWGDEVEKFDPSRFEREKFESLPPNSWKPFGNGQRACIGRPFAMQEAQLVLAMILQRFDLIEADPSYKLQIKETLTLKPDGFFIRVKKRGSAGFKARPSATATTQQPLKNTEAEPLSIDKKIPMLVLYGSNSGSAESFAQRISSEAQGQGYFAELATLDSYVGQLPKANPVIIVTASYEGQPTANAKQFVGWLDTLPANALSGVRFAVFGCGNRDWARTYQAIPRKIDEKLVAAGATPIMERGEADGRGDFFGDFDRWYDQLWKALAKTYGREVKAQSSIPQFDVEVVKETRSIILRLTDLRPAEIVENRELVNMSSPLGRSKRHIEIALPENMTYQCGDYLVVLPTNPKAYVDRALRRFGFDRETQIVIHQATTTQTSLPTGYPVNVSELLSNYVELAQPATKKNVEYLAQLAQCPPEKNTLANYLDEDVYKKDILEKRVSVLDLLDRYASCTIPFGLFLEMLPPMRARQYSISSSPLWNDKNCTVTVAVVKAPAWSGQSAYLGVASSFLAETTPGEKISVSIRPANNAFHLPENLETPIIMVCAGTGLAPFRGFVQERAIQAAHGRTLGDALLYFGCDHPDVDYLYRDEIQGWEATGIVKVRPAFSKASEEEIMYVQHRLWQERDQIMDLINRNARIYVCGDGRQMAPAVRETFMRIYQGYCQCTPKQAELWMSELERNGSRYVTDVFA